MAPTSTQFSATKLEAVAEEALAATKHELATAAALQMLEAGGNVIDAAVAAAFAVGVVEPSSSGLGGGGYLVYQLGERGGVFGFPMRAPQAARPDMYRLTGAAAVGQFGWPGVEGDANIEGARAIAVPGAVSGLCAAHREFGKLPLADVLGPAIDLADYGFPLGWYDVLAIGREAGKLRRHDTLAATFLADGNVRAGIEIPAPGGNRGELPYAAPARLRQPDLADTLRQIAAAGAQGFYGGAVARALIDAVAGGGGILTLDDLAAYSPYHWRVGENPAPVEVPFRGLLVRAAPYASGGMTSAMTLQLLDQLGPPPADSTDADRWHRYICSARLAWADRFAFFADPEEVDVPWRGMVAAAYAARRAAGIGRRAPSRFKSGDPWQEEGRRPGQRLPGSAPGYDSGTTHLCVMDAAGNGVSLTNTLMSGFGSGVVGGKTGVVMNNGMMWFDPQPGRVNSIAPGKLPLNNMSPLLIVEPGDRARARIAVGASGGRRITNCVTNLVTAIVDGGLGPQAAIDAPRVDCSTPLTAVDARLGKSTIEALRERNHQIAEIDTRYSEFGLGPFASPVAIVRQPTGSGELRGGADTFHAASAAGLD